MPVITTIQHRAGTAAQWTSANPILAVGELGLESDTSKFKFGNGTSTWNSLAYSTPDYTSSVQHAVKADEALTKGQAVYVSSANGTNMLVSKASNTAEATSSKTIGLITSTLALNGIGNVLSEGLLSGLDTSTATAGNPVWLGTAGNLIYGLAGKPVAPAHLVFIGIVTRAHATNGEIFVKVQNGFELEELHNVLITSAANKQVLQYDSATSLWKNAAISAGAAVGDTPPASPSANDIWWDSVGGRAYIYYDSFWVELSPGIVGPAGQSGVLTAVAVSSNITLASSNRYFVDTSAARTLTLPASSSLGDEVQIFDASGTAATNNITVANNSQKINGVLDSALLDTNGVAAAFIYTGSTYGWRLG